MKKKLYYRVWMPIRYRNGVPDSWFRERGMMTPHEHLLCWGC